MPQREDGTSDVNPASTKSLQDDDRDPLGPSPQVPSDIPRGLDRRKFIMRSAVISAAAVMTGCTRSETERNRPSASSRIPTGGRDIGNGRWARCPALPDLDVVKKEKGPVLTTADEFYKGGARSVQFAHDWSDAHYLRFLPASHQTAGRQTRQGDGAQGQPVRKPQRHRKGTRHGTRVHWRDWSGKSRQPSTRNFWTACETSLTRRSR